MTNYNQKGKINKTQVSFAELELFLKTVRDGDKKHVNIGILGENGSKAVEGALDFTEASLGAVQEFGSTDGTIPSRSFLRMPLNKYGQKIVDYIAQKDRKNTFQHIADGDIDYVFNQIGSQGLQIVDGAFATGGYGSWEPNKPSTIRQKGSAKPLIDTGTLRGSITFEVKDN